MSERNPQTDPNTPRSDVGDSDAQAGAVDPDATQYRLTRGELTRVNDDGELETISQDDVFEATDDEVRAFGDLLEPADGDRGVGQPVADQPIPENAGADYVGAGETGDREGTAIPEADDYDAPRTAAEDHEDFDGDSEVDQPVPEQTNATYESAGETGDREGTAIPEADDYPEPEADVDVEDMAGPAETQPGERSEVEKPTPDTDSATPDDESEGGADTDTEADSGNADAPDDAEGDAEEAIDAIPSDYDSMNVGDVRDYVDSENPDNERLQALLDYEREHKNRTTVTDDLEDRIESNASDSDSDTSGD